MRIQIANRLRMLRAGVAAELPASAPDRRAFVGVWVLPEGPYRIFKFEVPAASLEVDRYLAPDEVLDPFGVNAGSLEEVEERLAELGIDSDLLDVPWNSDYPL